MEDTLFVSLYCVIPICVFYLAKIARVRPLTISIPSIFIWFYLLFAYVGVLPLYFHWIPSRLAAGVSDRGIILRMFLYSTLSLVIIIVGFLAVRLTNIHTNHPDDIISPLKKSELAVALFLSLVCVLVLLIYLRKVPGIALFSALSGMSHKGTVLRSAMSGASSVVTHYWRYELFFGGILPFVTFILFAHALVKNSIKTYLLFLLVSAVTFFAALMSLHKAPTVRIFIGLGLVYILTKKRGKISFKFVAISVPCIFSMLIGMYIYFMGVNNIWDASGKVLSRGFTGQIHPAYYYLEMFPSYRDYLMGKSFPNPAGILPYEPYPLTVEVHKYAFPLKAITGSAPTVFWAELYANFGPIAPFVIAFMVGVGIFLIHILLSRLKPTPVKIGLTVWIGMHIAKLAFTSLGNIVVDFSMLAILSIAAGFLLMRGRGAIKFQRK